MDGASGQPGRCGELEAALRPRGMFQGLPGGDVIGNAELVEVAAKSSPTRVAVDSVGRLFHSIRFVNGSWQPFGDAKGQTGDMGALSQASCVAI